MKWIEGYEDLYKISKCGTVLSFKHGYPKVLRPGNNGHGYLYVSLSKEDTVKNFKVHRLVAQTYLENPENKPHINHKDCNKANNSVYNLEWCTIKENNSHYSIMRKANARKARKGKVTLQFSLNGMLIKEYASAAEACRELGLNNTALSQCLQGLRKTARGYVWKYKG